MTMDLVTALDVLNKRLAGGDEFQDASYLVALECKVPYADLVRAYEEMSERSTLRDLIEGVKENNRINDASWSDWTGLVHIEEVYGEFSDVDVSRAEAKQIIEAAIASNGESLAEDLRAVALRVWGQEFSGSWWDREPLRGTATVEL